MNKNNFKIGVIAAVGLFPMFVFAQQTVKTLACQAVGYIGLGVYLIIALAILVFVWNVYRYFIKSDAERKEAGLYVLYSVLGFFVILSLWGLVNIVTNSFNLQSNSGNSGFSVLPSASYCSGGSTSTGVANSTGVFGPSSNGGSSGSVLGPSSSGGSSASTPTSLPNNYDTDGSGMFQQP